MTIDPAIAAAGLSLLAVLLLLALWLRLRQPAMPPELAARLALLEQQVQALANGAARTEAGVQRLEDAQRTFTQEATRHSDAARQTLDARLAQMVDESRHGRAELAAALQQFAARFEQRIGGFDTSMTARFDALQQAVLHTLRTLAADTQRQTEQMRTALNERLAAIQADNNARLEEMRRTVDEKLHATLEQRLGESFRLVSERLEQVHAGLGEMKTLAGSVGDLKRVMTNVRTRGTWGEVQLGAIIESLLTAEQFERNVRTVEGSDERVEFAIKMPGRVDHEVVWLPIDSKYPVEDYQRLLDAHDSGDKELVQRATQAFAAALKNEARKIREKYLSPPKTTDFAILFVPTEGLFAEVCRIPGMVEALQNEYRVVVAGPTTLAAMLNSLRLGFRTLAIERRSSEVWALLAQVKTEFRKFGETIEATRRSIDTAARKFNDLGVRTRAIERRLRGVEELPAAANADTGALGLDEDDDADEPTA